MEGSSSFVSFEDKSTFLAASACFLDPLCRDEVLDDDFLGELFRGDVRGDVRDDDFLGDDFLGDVRGDVRGDLPRELDVDFDRDLELDLDCDRCPLRPGDFCRPRGFDRDSDRLVAGDAERDPAERERGWCHLQASPSLQCPFLKCLQVGGW